MQTWLCLVAVLAPPLSSCVPRAAAPAPPAAPPAVLHETPSASSAIGPPHAAPAMPGRNVPAIKVDTAGYPTTWPKIAIFNVEPSDVSVEDSSGALVLRVARDHVIARGRDEASRDPVWRVDLSDLTRPGRYVLLGGGARSEPFEVADHPYRTALIAAQKMFYFQRTRTRLEKPYAVWEGDEFLRAGVSHAHDDVGWLFEGYPNKVTRITVDAGWHDAGNFDMYVPSTAPTAHGLLRAYERHPALFRDGDLTIPESGNGVPDLLDEATWGIRWVLSMQHEDGGFRVREANARIGEPGPGPADRDRTVRWIDRVGSASTAKGCAMAAIAARVFRGPDRALAARAEAAARRAWAWLTRHPERVMVPPVGPAAIEQPYQLWDDGPAVASDAGARFAAAAEMWRTFRLPAALDASRASMNEHVAAAAELEYGSWGNLSRWALMTLADDAGAPADLRDRAKTRLLEAADGLGRTIAGDGYLCATKPADYYRGSNASLMERAEILAWAAYLDPQGHRWAREAARDQWHWILGRNPNGFSMVTRVGKGPHALYHMEWREPYPKLPPGYLLDGPNHHDMPFLAPDAPAKALLWESPQKLDSGVPRGELWHAQQSDLWESGFIPDNSWEKGWWCVVEPDIYANADLVLVAAEMQE